MKMVCVSRSTDVSTGLRLDGIEAYTINNVNEILPKIEELSNDETVGILGVTEDINNLFSDEIKAIKQKREMPLIVTIPNTILHKR